jgi:secretion/DNA translocation related CpaE-like protein
VDIGTPSPSVIVVATSDPDLLDRILSITAAVGIEPLVVNDAQLLRPVWATAAMVLVGADEAPRVAALGMRRRAEVYLLTDQSAPGAAHQWSMPLGAAVVTLPEGAGWLASAIAERGAPRNRTGEVICVVGGSGGVGASTFAAGLAFVAARAMQRALLVDADPYGGGLDLLLGAERVEGLRWPRLAKVRGQLGDLTGQLPRVDSVDVLAMARGEAPPGWALAAEQLEAVLESAVRSHDLTIVDLPRSGGDTAGRALDRADLIMLVVQGDVRGVAAAREVSRVIGGAGDQLGVVVRRGRTRLLSPDTVADGLGLRLLGTIPDDPSLALAAERGEPPARSPRAPMAVACREVLDLLADPAEPAWS